MSVSSSPSHDYIANRVIRELAELRDFEKFEMLTDAETHRALATVRKLCADVALNARGRFTT